MPKKNNILVSSSFAITETSFVLCGIRTLACILLSSLSRFSPCTLSTRSTGETTPGKILEKILQIEWFWKKLHYSLHFLAKNWAFNVSKVIFQSWEAIVAGKKHCRWKFFSSYKNEKQKKVWLFFRRKCTTLEVTFSSLESFRKHRWSSWIMLSVI